MKKLKMITLSVAISVAGFTAPVHAGGVPTIDAGTITQLGMQFENLVDQLENMKKRLEAITGDSAFEDLLDESKDKLHALYPEGFENFRSITDLLNNSKEMADQVNDIKSEIEGLNSKDLFNDRLSGVRTWYEKSGENLFAAMAVNENAQKVTAQRKVVFEKMREKIKEASTPKDRENLQLQLQLETLMVMNDILLAIQTERQLDLSEKNIERNQWARAQQQTTKLSDIKMSSPED